MYVLIIVTLTTFAGHSSSVPHFNGEALCTVAKEKVIKAGNGFIAAECVQVR